HFPVSRSAPRRASTRTRSGSSRRSDRAAVLRAATTVDCARNAYFCHSGSQVRPYLEHDFRHWAEWTALRAAPIYSYISVTFLVGYFGRGQQYCLVLDEPQYLLYYGGSSGPRRTRSERLGVSWAAGYGYCPSFGCAVAGQLWVRN